MPLEIFINAILFAIIHAGQDISQAVGSVSEHQGFSLPFARNSSS